jgi:hypothetical protein
VTHTLERFSTECRRLLKQDPGPAGRQKVCDLLREVLKDEATPISTTRAICIRRGAKGRHA